MIPNRPRWYSFPLIEFFLVLAMMVVLAIALGAFVGGWG
jgi:hypothetical protein